MQLGYFDTAVTLSRLKTIPDDLCTPNLAYNNIKLCERFKYYNSKWNAFFINF